MLSLDNGVIFSSNNQKFKEMETRRTQKNASGRRAIGSIMLTMCGSKQVDGGRIKK